MDLKPELSSGGVWTMLREVQRLCLRRMMDFGQSGG